MTPDRRADVDADRPTLPPSAPDADAAAYEASLAAATARAGCARSGEWLTAKDLVVRMAQNMKGTEQ